MLLDVSGFMFTFFIYGVISMTVKQKYAIDTIIDKTPDEYKSVFKEIAEYTVSLGYIPSIKGAKEQYVSFSKGYSKPKINRTILKIVVDLPKESPHIEMKFFAVNPPYSPFFRKAIENWIDTWGFGQFNHYCKHCGNCNGIQLYYSTYPDGEEKFTCGAISLIYMPPVSIENVDEIKNALKMQDDFYIKMYTRPVPEPKYVI